MSQHHPHGWFDQIHHPIWHHPSYEHNNHYENYLQTQPYAQPPFQHLNYNYADLDISYKNGDNLSNLQRPNNQPRLGWTNDVVAASQNNTALVIDHDNHSQVNDHHNHYHPLQTVGILFNGPANEPRQIGDARLRENDAKHHQKFTRDQSTLNSNKTEALLSNQQHPLKINIYANNSNWKQHLDDGGLATLPRRPFSSQAFHPHSNPYNNTDGLELSSNYNPHFMGGFKMNLSQSPSSGNSSTGLC